jgi:hypothetical protein
MNDTWEWDGVQWRKLDEQSVPTTRPQPNMVFDALHAHLLVFDSENYRLWSHSFASQSAPADRCTDVDTDGDGLVACADPDCWARCTPRCPPRASCDPAAPHCGDGVCSVLEDHLLCPADCP